MNMVPRLIEPRLRRSLRDSPVVYLNGPRQAGKSTLCRSLGEEFHYLTFDKASTQAAANADPTAFVSSLALSTIIDEVQLVPEIFRSIKHLIDELRIKNQLGQLILTGSADIMAIPKLAESLVGRMQVLTLLPFSAAEIFDGNIDFIPNLFNKAPAIQKLDNKINIYDVIQKATFPEVAVGEMLDKTAWYENYVSNIINRDIKALADIDKISHLPRMLKLLAARAGNLFSYASFSRDAALAVTTCRRYLTLFQHVYLVMMIEPWFKNISKRIVKSPKIYFTDTALLLATIGRSSIDDYVMKGAMLENFVASELMKHIQCLGSYKLFHFRTSDDKEVDFIVERTDGAIIGVEVKYSSTLTGADFKGLKALKEAAGKDFIRGVVLYQGDEILPFGDNLFAMPISCLWRGYASHD